MAHFVLRDHETKMEIRWEDGILSCTDEAFLAHLHRILKIVHRGSGGRIYPKQWRTTNPDAPPHTKDFWFVFAYLYRETVWGKGFFMDGEVVDFYIPPEPKVESSLPGGLVLD